MGAGLAGLTILGCGDDDDAGDGTIQGDINVGFISSFTGPLATVYAPFVNGAKLAIKEIASKHGLMATFMGKPLEAEGTSGYHLHLSLWENSDNAFEDPQGQDGLSDLCRYFIAGQLEHGRAMTAGRRWSCSTSGSRAAAWTASRFSTS